MFVIRKSLLCSSLLCAASLLQAAEPPRVVFEGGRSLPPSALSLNGDRFTVKAAQNGFTQNQSFPTSLATYVSGTKPPAIHSAIALLLMDQPNEAIKLLEPVLEEHKATAKIPGNFWVEAARTAVVAYAAGARPAPFEALGKELSDATPEPGNDPAVALGKVLLLPLSTTLNDRIAQFDILITDVSPPAVTAYALFYRAQYQQKAKRNDEALESYLTIPNVYPTGSIIINGVAEMRAAELLSAQNRRDEAITLLTSASIQTHATAAAEEAQKRLKSLQ